MEHIVQFAISIDDQTIAKRIEENAYSDIINMLVKDAKKTLPKKYGEPDFERLTEYAVRKLCEEHKDKIFDLAAEKLADSFKRTKVFKEKMADSLK